jgi:prolyl-tRNA editing enzyme YbaK/EbsC (Cys-tRNA(Pro) deacylase)
MCFKTHGANPGIVENPILHEAELSEYLSHIVGGVCAFGLRLRGRTQCVLPRKRKSNVTTPWGI